MSSSEDTFNSALCCYLNILYWRKKTYVPAKVLVPTLATKILNDHSPEGLRRAFSKLKRSAAYVYQVTKGWTLELCHNCGNEFKMDSWYFVRKEVRLRCKRICISCNSTVTTCIQCDGRCGCCMDKSEPFIQFFRLYPIILISHCMKNDPSFYIESDVHNRCCSKFYKYFDDAMRLFWEPRCEICEDRVECLLTRG